MPAISPKPTISPQSDAGGKKRRTIPGLRWWIISLLFGAAVLNYVDRQTLSALAPTIQTDLGMDDRDYANVVNIFLIAYTIAYLISGRVTDRLGTRAGMVLFVAWWSVANMITAGAQGMRSMSFCRFALGLGEAGVADIDQLGLDVQCPQGGGQGQAAALPAGPQLAPGRR